MGVWGLLNAGEKSEHLRELVGKLMKMQAKDGSWSAEAFCLDPARGKTPYYAGSRALTTAWVVRALDEYLKVVKPIRTKRVEVQAKRVMTQVWQMAEAEVESLGPKLKLEVRKWLIKLKGQDASGVVVLTPFWYALALYGNRWTRVAGEELVVKLGMGSVWGWLSYTIVDHLLDGEAEAEWLPVALVALRRLGGVYEEVEREVSGAANLYTRWMDEMDEANFGEVTQARAMWPADRKELLGMKLPNWGKVTMLSLRSMGHALGPAVVAMKGGASGEASRQFYELVLSARQLNDEMHDWVEDLRAGRLTYVNTRVLRWAKESRVKPTEEEMTKGFWEALLTDMAQEVLELGKRAGELVKAESYEKPEVVLEMIEQQMLPARKALRERQRTLEFLGKVEY
jgi:hypothetical protein